MNSELNSYESYCSHMILFICSLLLSHLRFRARWTHPATSLQGGWPWDQGRYLHWKGGTVACNDLKQMLELHVTTRPCWNISYYFICPVRIDTLYWYVHLLACPNLRMRMVFGYCQLSSNRKLKNAPVLPLVLFMPQVPDSIEEYSLAAQGVGWQQTSIQDICILRAWPRTYRHLTAATLVWFATAK